MAEVALRSSEIADLGVFAVEAVASGEVIRELEIEREVTADDPLRPERGERPEYASLIDGRFLLIGTPDRYLNHSCDPNAYLRFGIEAIQVGLSVRLP